MVLNHHPHSPVVTHDRPRQSAPSLSAECFSRGNSPGSAQKRPLIYYLTINPAAGDGGSAATRNRCGHPTTWSIITMALITSHYDAMHSAGIKWP